MLNRKTFIAIIVIIAILIILVIIFINVNKPRQELPEIAEEIYGLSGEIKKVRSSYLLVEAKILLADFKKEPIKQVVKMIVNDETKILKLKFPEEIPAESTDPIFPEETEIGFNDLKPGDKVDVQTVDNVSDNIKNGIEFVVKVINVIE